MEYFSEDTPLAPRPEAAVAGLLLVAMAAGEDLHVDAPLDPAFKGHLDTIQDVYTTWTDGLHRVNVVDGGAEDGHSGGEHSGAESGSSAQRKTAAFFSGGVDSFYTLLKHREDIDALIFVHGFDLKLTDRDLRSAVSQKLQEVADAYGMQLVEVETTLREFTERKRMTPRFANWSLSHGSALASVAHVLSNQFQRIYVPATHTYSDVIPWGSHPLLDPQWSSGGLQIVYDGAEANRLQKCEAIAQHPVALNTLRVCWKNPGGEYNCGRCEKCVRTMLMLKSLGALEQSKAFPMTLTSYRIATTWIRKNRTEKYYKLLLSRLGNDQKQLRQKIKMALAISKFKRGARSILQWISR